MSMKPQVPTKQLKNFGMMKFEAKINNVVIHLLHKRKKIRIIENSQLKMFVFTMNKIHRVFLRQLN